MTTIMLFITYTCGYLAYYKFVQGIKIIYIVNDWKYC